MPAPSLPVATPPVTRLQQLEKVIEAGLAQFVSVGAALKEIHDRQLYKPEYGTWEVYCRHRWGFSRRRGYQLIAAVEVGTIVRANIPEGQARILANQPPNVAQRAYEAVTSQGKATAAKLEEMVNEINAEEEARLRNAPPAERPKPQGSARARLEQIRGLCKRLKRLHAGLVDVADAADTAIEAYLAVVEGTTES